jgi:hypothetical protein
VRAGVCAREGARGVYANLKAAFARAFRVPEAEALNRIAVAEGRTMHRLQSNEERLTSLLIDHQGVPTRASEIPVRAVSQSAVCYCVSSKQDEQERNRFAPRCRSWSSPWAQGHELLLLLLLRCLPALCHRGAKGASPCASRGEMLQDGGDDVVEPGEAFRLKLRAPPTARQSFFSESSLCVTVLARHRVPVPSSSCPGPLLLQGHKLCSKWRMSIWKLRLGLNPFTLLLAVLVGLVCVVSYFYMLSFLLGDASPDQGPGSDQDGRRRLLWGEQQGVGSCTVSVLQRAGCCVG